MHWVSAGDRILEHREHFPALYIAGRVSIPLKAFIIQAQSQSPSHTNQYKYVHTYL